MNTDGVVIGSRSIAEYKYQTIAFMERLYRCIVEDRDYSYLGYSNLSPWSSNLIFYIKKLEETKKYNFGECERCQSLVSAIRLNLEALTKTDSAEYKKSVKKICLVHWEELLKLATSRYNLEYKRID